MLSVKLEIVYGHMAYKFSAALQVEMHPLFGGLL